MFDANAAHIKCNSKFFAEIHSMNNQLLELGFRRGDIVLCYHTEKSGERLRKIENSMLWNPTSRTWVEYRDELRDCDGRMGWLVYSGRPNGQGFINETWKTKALAVLDGEWISD